MAIRILVVDDSRFFQRRIIEILEDDSGLKVVGSAVNGMEAIKKAAELKPDVITMDIEMPVMDGITAVRKIMAETPTPVLMFSTLTSEGAKATMDALDAGALDFIPKTFEDISKDRDEAKNILRTRVRMLAQQAKRTKLVKAAPNSTSSATGNAFNKAKNYRTDRSSRIVSGALSKKFRMVVLGTSTGGPVALQQVLSKLPASFPVPILVVQHMPENFTAAFATRLNSACKIAIKQASAGEVLKPGVVYIAPGGKQIKVDARARACIEAGEKTEIYKPCVDITLNSLAKSFSNKVLAVILTGMGADGCEGSKSLKKAGSTIWSQDQASCVIYGMPMAVAQAGISERVLSPPDIGQALAREF